MSFIRLAGRYEWLNLSMVLFAVAGILLPRSLQAADKEPPTEWIEPETGHRVVARGLNGRLLRNRVDWRHAGPFRGSVGR